MRQFTFKQSTYSRTDSGKSWRSQPDEVETKTVSEEFHRNMTSDDTLKFFRRLGGSETVTREYTAWGYIVCRVVSTNPDRTIKHVREFEPIEEEAKA